MVHREPNFLCGEAYLRAADALMALGRWDDADDALERHVKINSSSLEGRFKRVRVCKARNDAEGSTRGVALTGSSSLLEGLDSRQLQQVAVSKGLQALWQAVLPMVGIVPARPDEYAGVFKVEPGPGDDEATIYVDIASDGYEPGRTPKMERVVALTVRLSHDYRLLGEHYYCVDCDPPTQETRH